MLRIPALGRYRQEDREFKVFLGYTARLSSVRAIPDPASNKTLHRPEQEVSEMTRTRFRSLSKNLPAFLLASDQAGLGLLSFHTLWALYLPGCASLAQARLQP